jgi:hypothetical protein
MTRAPGPTNRFSATRSEWRPVQLHRRRRWHSEEIIPSPSTPPMLAIETSPDVEDQMARLYLLELENQRNGADLRHEAYVIGRAPELRSRLELSDQLVESLPCHVQLRPKRRRGVLCHLSNGGGMP